MNEGDTVAKNLDFVAALTIWFAVVECLRDPSMVTVVKATGGDGVLTK